MVARLGPKIFDAENNGNKRLFSHPARTKPVHGHHVPLPLVEQRQLGSFLGGAESAQLCLMNLFGGLLGMGVEFFAKLPDQLRRDLRDRR